MQPLQPSTYEWIKNSYYTILINVTRWDLNFNVGTSDFILTIPTWVCYEPKHVADSAGAVMRAPAPSVKGNGTKWQSVAMPSEKAWTWIYLLVRGFTAMWLKIRVFWHVTLCCWASASPRFEGLEWHHIQGVPGGRDKTSGECSLC